MSDRLLPGIAFLVATAIVCGASFVIASKGGDIVAGKAIQGAAPNITAAPQPQVQPQVAARVAGPESLRPPAAAPSPHTKAEIVRIDRLARVGGPASYQDGLRDRRHKLVDEKYALKC